MSADAWNPSTVRYIYGAILGAIMVCTNIRVNRLGFWIGDADCDL